MANVATPSEWHTENSPVWARCRAAIEGGDAVRALGTAIVPAIGGMDRREFSGYLQRATYMNASQRTLDALVGLVMQKPAQYEMPPALEELATYIDGRGGRIEDFARHALAEVLSVGGGLALVDHPERPDGVVTAAQERALGLRPLVSWYPLESVLEYRTGIVNGYEEITWLKLLEHYEEHIDEWTVDQKKQVRVYCMCEGRVWARVFRKTADGQWTLFSESWPVAHSGQPITYIPAVFFGPIKNEPGKSPMLDLIDMNLAHFRNSADHEHVLHFTGLPTPYVAGVSPDDFPSGLKLGSSAAQVFEDANAKIAFAEISGDSSALATEMLAKEARMAALGARALAPEGRQAESGDALAIRRGGEHSALAKVADSVSRSMVLVLETLAEWEGIDGDISYSLNVDYLPQSVGAQELIALMQAWQGGAISAMELFDLLRKGGVIRDDKEYEEHERELSEEAGFLDQPLEGGAFGA